MINFLRFLKNFPIRSEEKPTVTLATYEDCSFKCGKCGKFGNFNLGFASYNGIAIHKQCQVIVQCKNCGAKKPEDKMCAYCEDTRTI